MNPLGLLRALPVIVLQAIHDAIAYGPLDTPEAQAAWIQNGAQR